MYGLYSNPANADLDIETFLDIVGQYASGVLMFQDIPPVRILIESSTDNKASKGPRSKLRGFSPIA